MADRYDGCSSMAECTVVVRETRVRFPPSISFLKDFLREVKQDDKTLFYNW